VPGRKIVAGLPAIVTTPFFGHACIAGGYARSIRIPTILLDELDHRADFIAANAADSISVRQHVIYDDLRDLWRTLSGNFATSWQRRYKVSGLCSPDAERSSMIRVD